MGRGLSAMQKHILEILPPRPQADVAFKIDGLQRPREIILALGLPNTNSNRAAVSRSLARLCKRGLALAWTGEVCSQGRGYSYSKS